jgi:cytochrome c biogenesis protein CcdA
MSAVDGWLEGLLHGQVGFGVVLVISLLLGLRHASDPDHLAAVTTLIASDEERAGKAGVMGLLWGAGHGTALVLIGLPLVLAEQYLPEPVRVGAEVLVGGIIILLAVRLLLRWRRGLYHAHIHGHGGESSHVHVHSHREQESHEHAHAIPHRTPLSAYGIGLVHGIGGSSGLTLLLLSTITDKVEATGALLLFAAGTAVSMAVLSTAFGLVIAGGPVRRRFDRLAPVLGVLSMAFGAWYALGALGIMVYPF